MRKYAFADGNNKIKKILIASGENHSKIFLYDTKEDTFSFNSIEIKKGGDNPCLF